MGQCFIDRKGGSENKNARKVIPISIFTDTSKPDFMVDEYGWVSGFNVADSNAADNPDYSIHIDKDFAPQESNWEMLFNFMITKEPTKSGAICGAMGGNYFHAPSIEIQSLTSIWIGYSTNGTSWNYGNTITLTDPLKLNTEYYLRYEYYDGTLSLSISTDNNVWTILHQATEIPITYQQSTGYGMSVGNVMRTQRLPFTFGKINILNSYIKIGDKYYWGGY